MKRCTVEHYNFTRSAATEFRCGRRFYFTIFRSLSTNSKVKELLKSIHNCRSYRKNKSGIFMAYGIDMLWQCTVSTTGPICLL